MEIAFALRWISRGIRFASGSPEPFSLRSLSYDNHLNKPLETPPPKTSKIRKRVLRRDRYGCRGCDRDESKVTLTVHPINSRALDEHGMLTLCKNCTGLVERTQITAESVPEFLRLLWSQLYPAHHQ